MKPVGPRGESLWSMKNMTRGTGTELEREGRLRNVKDLEDFLNLLCNLQNLFYHSEMIMDKQRLSWSVSAFAK